MFFFVIVKSRRVYNSVAVKETLIFNLFEIIFLYLGLSKFMNVYMDINIMLSICENTYFGIGH